MQLALTKQMGDRRLVFIANLVKVLQSREINEPGGEALVRLVRIIARFWVVRVFARSELLSLVDPDKGATRCSGGPRHRYLIYSIQPTGVPERP